MIKKALVIIMLIGPPFLAENGGCAQGSDNELLSEFYAFHTTGQAQLAKDEACSVHGLVAAGITDGFISFDGGGRIIQGEAGISIGATSCTSPNYSVSGTYRVTARDQDSFTATGTLTYSFGGRPAACSGTFLNAQPFSLIGRISDSSFTIQTSGAGGGSTYAEGPPQGPLTCSATVVNFVTSGTGTKNPSALPAA
ncbi:MAG: hypothetical protein HY650_02675 [Acidobacteria bacterium]|nr:hypothetical protein [Acidobacteriota bacterium]